MKGALRLKDISDKYGINHVDNKNDLNTVFLISSAFLPCSLSLSFPQVSSFLIFLSRTYKIFRRNP